MIKLSELPDDTMLIVDSSYLEVMTKSEFLDSAYYLDYPTEPFPSVKLATKKVLSFDLYEAINRIGEDDSYEGWTDEVYEALIKNPATTAFLERVRTVLEHHPMFEEGKPVEVDMIAD